MTSPDWLNHPPLDSESVFDEFVREFGGQKVPELVGKSPSFENADYLFRRENVIAELKTLKTDFGQTKKFKEDYSALMRKYAQDGRMTFGAIFRPNERPPEFILDFLRLFRPPLERILKKANGQIKDTRANTEFKDANGVLILVNDEFYSLEPRFIMAVLGDKLVHSYKAIDAFVYLTLNHYVDTGDRYARLLWAPQYSERAPASLQSFINALGARWFEFLEEKLGPFDISTKTDDGSFLNVTRAIVPPKRG